jgi:hypothetical protein
LGEEGNQRPLRDIPDDDQPTRQSECRRNRLDNRWSDGKQQHDCRADDHQAGGDDEHGCPQRNPSPTLLHPVRRVDSSTERGDVARQRPHRQRKAEHQRISGIRNAQQLHDWTMQGDDRLVRCHAVDDAQDVGGRVRLVVEQRERGHDRERCGEHHERREE